MCLCGSSLASGGRTMRRFCPQRSQEITLSHLWFSPIYIHFFEYLNPVFRATCGAEQMLTRTLVACSLKTTYTA